MLFYLLSIGCRYHLQIQTTPVQAEVVFQEEKYIVQKKKHTDFLDVTLKKPPFKKPKLIISSTGYRTLETRLQLQRRHLIFKHINQVHFILISEHQEAGSWEPEDALKNP